MIDLRAPRASPRDRTALGLTSEALPERFPFGLEHVGTPALDAHRGHEPGAGFIAQSFLSRLRVQRASSPAIPSGGLESRPEPAGWKT